MAGSNERTPFKSAANILTWLEAIGERKLPIDLDLVRQMLPTTPYGKGTVLREPAPVIWGSSEGALVRNPDSPNEWGIFYNDKARPERQRFTLAHELGHFVLHRDSHASFNCDKESIYTGADTLKQIEREADEFASNLLMPGDLLRERIADKRIDFHLMGELAKTFGVSLEAMCIRLIKFTEQRAVLVHWDYGFMKYQWRSQSAIRTRVRLHCTGDPQEPLPNTLAADENVIQEWDGIKMPAQHWCSSEPPEITLREMKHSYPDGNRVLSLLVLESAAPRSSAGSGWEDEHTSDSYNRYMVKVSAGNERIHLVKKKPCPRLAAQSHNTIAREPTPDINPQRVAPSPCCHARCAAPRLRAPDHGHAKPTDAAPCVPGEPHAAWQRRYPAPDASVGRVVVGLQSVPQAHR